MMLRNHKRIDIQETVRPITPADYFHSEDKIKLQIKNPIVAKAMTSWVNKFCNKLEEKSEEWNKFIDEANCKSREFWEEGRLCKIHEYSETIKSTAEIIKRAVLEWPENIDIVTLVEDLANIADYGLPSFRLSDIKIGYPIRPVYLPMSQLTEKLKSIRDNLNRLLNLETPTLFSLHLSDQRGSIGRTYLRQSANTKQHKKKKSAATKTKLVTSITQPPFDSNRHMESSVNMSVYQFNNSCGELLSVRSRTIDWFNPKKLR